jgi:hypothetical protein
VKRTIIILAAFALTVTACSGADSEPAGHDTPERAVASWFEAIDAGDTVAASGAIHPHSLALILGTENDLPVEVTTDYLDNGVPVAVQESYWSSFAEGFSAFAARPVSTLAVGQATTFASEGVEFARVPVSGGQAVESLVIARMRDDGTWEVDMVATLADGFAKVLLGAYADLPEGEVGDLVRDAYKVTVVPSMWAAMAEGDFGEDFARSALALIEEVEADSQSEG